MGGKTWSKEEEEVYWTQLIPHSPKRLGADLANKERSWDWVAVQMTRIMGDIAKEKRQDPRREYTHLCVFEHYFQNTYLARFSPNVGRLPMKYYRREQRDKKRKEAAALKKAQLEAAAAELEAAGQATSPIVIDSTGDQQDTPIVINCQYPAVASDLHGQALVAQATPTPQFTIPSVLPKLAPPRSVPRPQYHFHQFLANHDRLDNTGSDEDSLFVTQSTVSWSEAVGPPRGYGCPQFQ
ncbi:hypothetical protein C8A00DRAFT_29415 [Chaetomidium leptoderma]|uniref:Uncharacterized protein n=1 Tax=Chaetomidium leptoderma TaxID=669021 RepID=A0AAN6VUL1_9PEZI|nr:hypothetical protein C8A00DRAFT_29415 [Chaetomidium leptoderma]